MDKNKKIEIYSWITMIFNFIIVMGIFFVDEIVNTPVWIAYVWGINLMLYPLCMLLASLNKPK